MPPKVQKKQLATQEKAKINMPFLEKFKGKHSIVSKQGLIDLLNQKKKPACTNISNSEIRQHRRPNSFSSQPVGSPTKAKKAQQLQPIVLKQSNSMKKYPTNLTKSAYVQDKSLSKLKPISVVKATSSKSHDIRMRIDDKPASKQSIIKNASLVSNNKKSPLISKQPPVLKKQVVQRHRYRQEIPFQLDKFAVDHLSLLDKFEQRMRGGKFAAETR